MTALIYLVCFFVSYTIQALMRLLFRNSSILFIPGTIFFYGIAIWVAGKWSKNYRERKERRKQEKENKKNTEEEGERHIM